MAVTSGNNRFTKDPDATLDYYVDWGANWISTGDSISTSTWSVTPSGTGVDLTVDSSTKDVDNKTKVVVSGGAEGQEYRLTNTIVTDNGLTQEQTLIIKVEEK